MNIWSCTVVPGPAHKFMRKDITEDTGAALWVQGERKTEKVSLRDEQELQEINFENGMKSLKMA